jgi:hypothetical protein
MNTIQLEFDIGTTDANAALGVRVLLDNSVVYDNPHVTETYHVNQEISDEDGEHELSIEFYGKLPEHTKVNEAGDIEQDALITVTNLHLDGIDIGQLAQDLFEYHHDFNGTQQPVVEKFYGSFGCNGHVKLKFTSPVYLWLLENM